MRELVINEAVNSRTGLPIYNVHVDGNADSLMLRELYGPQDAGKKQLVNNLIENVCCWEEKDREMLNALGIETLRTLTEHGEQRQQQQPQGPSFIGAATPFAANANHYDADEDILPLPTMNFEKPATPARRPTTNTHTDSDILPLPHMDFSKK